MELHLSPKVVSKGSKGRTACGSAAYRSCSRIVDNDGVVHDFRNKREYVTGGIELPEGAPEDLRDPQTLWQRHELHDKRKDAQLYRDVEFAVPNELSYAACERIVRGMAAELTKRGMCVQWDIHDKCTYRDEEGNVVDNPRKKIPGKTYVEIRNLHVHMMLTMRELLPDGTFGNKVRAWNKFNGGLNISDLLRPKAAELMNRELAVIRSGEHVEHLSFADRGVDRIPTTHVGTSATAMERKGQPTQRGTRNNYIEFLNEIHVSNLREAEKKIKKLDDLIAQAEDVKDGREVFRDWDALFGLLRDTRRARAALKSEKKRFEKIAIAYGTGDVGYLKWVGCNPDDENGLKGVQNMQRQIDVFIDRLDIAEALILDSKDLFKAHNKLRYMSDKVSWDQYQIDKKLHRIGDYNKRIKSINAYIKHLTSEISLLDAIFNTAEYQEYTAKVNSLNKKLLQLREGRQTAKEEIREHKADLQKDKRELKDAKSAAKKAGDVGDRS